MQVSQVLILARKHLGKGSMESSARLCLEDAIKLHDDGDLMAALTRARKSIAYSVGIAHADYKRSAM